jgi:arsenate reductase (thioredoxin)
MGIWQTLRMNSKVRLLFLCTANAARSQMAEALARLDHGDLFEVHSAGSRAAGWVHPLAIRAMEDLGADMSGHTSKSSEKYLGEDFDYVVTVCDSAASDCPVWPKAKNLLHWPIVDPSYGPDDPLTRFDRFIERRDELRSRINELAAKIRLEQSR